jgi:4-diphosphocytidyl-2-C-methyl-D-erythritol kinase
VAKIVVIKSLAKINLYLDVICRRPDGYHNIETVFQTISLCDVLRIELIPAGIEVTCDNPAVPTDESNLACRAFLELSKAVGYEGGIRLDLKKNIPPGSGLGGGSSNAAATLAALDEMLGSGLPKEQLWDIARGLGADVPFFLTGGVAAAWGIGDKIEPLPPMPESFVVIAVPRGLAVSTAVAYGMLQAPECGEYNPQNISDCDDELKSRADALRSGGPLSEINSTKPILHNSLEEPVFSRHPEIAGLKKTLIEAGATGALMTGSGSAVYGLAESEERAHKLRETLEKQGGCDCFVAKTTDEGRQAVDSP